MAGTIDEVLEKENHYIIRQQNFDGSSNDFGPFIYVKEEDKNSVFVYNRVMILESMKNLESVELNDVSGRQLLSYTKSELGKETLLPAYLARQVLLVRLVYIDREEVVRVFLD
jgi:hypothetical protein